MLKNFYQLQLLDIKILFLKYKHLSIVFILKKYINLRFIVCNFIYSSKNLLLIATYPLCALKFLANKKVIHIYHVLLIQ